MANKYKSAAKANRILPLSDGGNGGGGELGTSATLLHKRHFSERLAKQSFAPCPIEQFGITTTRN